MIKKWSLKVIKIEKKAQNVPQGVQNSTPTSNASPVNEQKTFGEPGKLYYAGEGNTYLFKRPLSGKEAKAMIQYNITPERVLNSIQRSLFKNGFDTRKTDYSPQQINFFKNAMEKDLLSEYNSILNLLNEDVFK